MRWFQWGRQLFLCLGLISLLTMLKVVWIEPTYAAGATGTKSHYLVKDIDVTTFAELGGTLLFNAQTDSGWGLWRSDGTSTGTTLVKEIHTEGQVFGELDQTVVYKGAIYFSADDGVYGSELWKSDGTAAGTVLVKDLLPGTEGSSPLAMTLFQERLFFSVYAGGGLHQLWKTDGSNNGTHLVVEAGAREIAVLGDRLIFSGHSNEEYPSTLLWTSNGTSAALVMTHDEGNAQPIQDPYLLTPMNGAVYFFPKYQYPVQLWRTDGTGVGTSLVLTLTQNVGVPENMAAVNNRIVFDSQQVESYERQLWASDGTSAGTEVLATFGSDVYLSGFIDLGGVILFSANGTQPELWRTDGTSDGTYMIKSVPDFDTTKVDVAGGVLYFMESDHLWRSDGTAAGTFIVTSGVAASDVEVVGDLVFFGALSAWHLTNQPPVDLLLSETMVATHQPPGSVVGAFQVDDDSPSATLTLAPGEGDRHNNYFALDGTTLKATATFYDEAALKSFHLRVRVDDHYGGVLEKSLTISATSTGAPPPPLYLVKDVIPGIDGFNGTASVAGSTADYLFFTAPGEGGDELWVTDGTAAGTGRLSGTVASGWRSEAVVDNRLFFLARDDDHGVELWGSDGTLANTLLVKDIRSGAASSQPQWLTNAGGTLFFAAYDDTHGHTLWRSDGSAAGTFMVHDINPNSADPDYQLTEMTAIGNIVYFVINAPTYQLWKSDGTAIGTEMVKDFKTNFAETRQLMTVGDLLFFTSDHPDGLFGAGRELWKSDGTEVGTVMVKDISPGGHSDPTQLTAAGDTLFFLADDGTHGRKLWKSDGSATGTTMVGNWGAGNLTAVGNLLFFTANHGGEQALWKSDGSEAGTIAIRNIAEIDLLYAAGDTLFFRGGSSQAAKIDYELWRSDGSVDGTVRVADLEPGPDGSWPAGFGEWRGILFFGATTSITGSELWALRLGRSVTLGIAGGVLDLGMNGNLTLPANVLTAETQFSYTPHAAPSHPLPEGFLFAGQVFKLQAQQGNQLISHPFQGGPAYLRLFFDPAVIAAGSARILYYDTESSQWRDVATTCDPPAAYIRGVNFVESPLCHLTEFALVQTESPRPIFLPTLFR